MVKKENIEFRKLMRSLGLDYHDVADLFDRSITSVLRWSYGPGKPPAHVMIMLNLVKAKPDILEDLKRLIKEANNE